jgi:hypothetical protein
MNRTPTQAKSCHIGAQDFANLPSNLPGELPRCLIEIDRSRLGSGKLRFAKQGLP